MRKIITLLLVVLSLMIVPGIANAAYQSYGDVVLDIEKNLQQALADYESGNVDKAKEWVNEGYFGPYEGGQMEKAVRLNISAASNAKIEGLFRQIKSQIKAGESPEKVAETVELLLVVLRENAKTLDGDKDSPVGMFISSFLIIVREGFEAILVLGAIIAYLVKSGNGSKVKTIYHSALAALGASVLTAVAIKLVFKVSGASQEILEGVTMLIAVVVLFSVSYWLFSKVEAKKWQQYIEGKVQDSLSAGNTLALWVASFLAVYREGAETVLFYQALIAGSGEQLPSITAGFLVGSVALVIIFYIVRYGSIKLPLKPFFITTGVLLYYLAFVFAGQGISELQAGGAVSVTPISIPTIGFLGINPSLESTILQACLLLAAIVGIAYQVLNKGKADSLKNISS